MNIIMKMKPSFSLLIKEKAKEEEESEYDDAIRRPECFVDDESVEYTTLSGFGHYEYDLKDHVLLFEGHRNSLKEGNNVFPRLYEYARSIVYIKYIKTAAPNQKFYFLDDLRYIENITNVKNVFLILDLIENALS